MERSVPVEGDLLQQGTTAGTTTSPQGHPNSMRDAMTLPQWPSRGNRRRLEKQWLVELERHGLAAHIAGPPAGPPPELHRAIQEFNEGAYWDCHETLEEVWLNTPYPLRFFYHSIIKAAVGFHHLGRRNRHGARVKLSDCVRLLRLFPPEYLGVRTGRLLDDALLWLARVDNAERLDWEELDALRRPAIQVVGRDLRG